MSLEIKKAELEYMRVKTARMDLEYKIAERTDEIERLEENIKIQKEKEAELEEKIRLLKK